GHECRRRNKRDVERAGEGVQLVKCFVFKTTPLDVEKWQRDKTGAPHGYAHHVDELEPCSDHRVAISRSCNVPMSRQRTTASSGRFAGTHMIRPPSCWSSSGVSPKAAVVVVWGA